MFTTAISRPQIPVMDASDWVPRTLLEAHQAWEASCRRNLEIRRRFQAGRGKDVLLRSAARLPDWPV